MPSVTTKDIQNLYSKLACIIKTSSSSDATLLALQDIFTSTFGISNKLTILTEEKSPQSFVTNSTITIPIGATEVSIFNNGNIDGIANGTIIPAGVTRTFGFKNPIDTVLNVDGTGTELLIDYML